MTSPLPDPGCPTNWPAYNVPRLWAMVAHEDNPETWRQIAALGDMADTVKDQKNRLRTAREALVEAWPPEKNPAARAFVDQIDILLRNMDVQKATAEKNAAALGHIAEALRQAKEKIKPLYEQYLEKSDDKVPQWWDNAEDDLDRQARRHMADAEKVVAAHAVQITAPPPYRLNVAANVYERLESFGPEGDAQSARPMASGTSRAPEVGAGGLVVPHDPPPPLPGREPTPVDTRPLPSPGVGLAGVAQAVAMPTTASPGVGGQVVGAAGHPGMIIGGAPLPAVSVPPARFVGGAGGTARGTLPIGTPIGQPTSTPTGMPINRPVQPSWLPTTPVQSGVIGTTNPSGRGGGSAGGAVVPVAPHPAGRGQAGNAVRHQPLDADNPWSTAEGVEQVIEPPQHHPRHDPGPAVIGWRG